MILLAIIQEQVLPVPEGYSEWPVSSFHESDNM